MSEDIAEPSRLTGKGLDKLKPPAKSSTSENASPFRGNLLRHIADAEARRLEEKRISEELGRTMQKDPEAMPKELAYPSSKRDSISDAETAADNEPRFNHPEIFEDPERVTVDDKGKYVQYAVEGIGIFSLVKDYKGSEEWLQVDVIELEGEALQTGGYGTDFYKYVLGHLPKGYQGLRSGNIDNKDSPIHGIYRKLEAAGYPIIKTGAVEGHTLPTLYEVMPKPKLNR